MPCDGPVHLRRASVADAAGIAEVHNHGWQKAYSHLVPPEYLHCVTSKMREEFWREALKVGLADREPWLALLDERIIGFASGGMSRDEMPYLTEVGEVYQLFVDPECWSQGIRTNLIDHVSRDLREHGFERVTLWVLADDAEARKFMAHLGWSADGATRFEECGGAQVEQIRYTHALR